MMVHEWAGWRVPRRIAGAGRGVWRRGRWWVVVAVALVAGACLVMLVTTSGHADHGCTARCSQYEGGMVAGGSQQVYLVFSGRPRAGEVTAG